MKTLAIGISAGALALAATTDVSAQDTFRTAGGTIGGVLSQASYTLNGRYVACYAIDTRAGENYEALLRSSAFDTHLAAAEGEVCSAPPVVEDDDGADGTNSQVRFVGTGKPWFLRVSSFSAGSGGQYELRFNQRDVYTPGLDIGGSATGALDGDDLVDTSGLPFDCVPFRALINQSVDISLRSDAFDARLGLHEGVSCQGPTIADDDDGGAGTDALISTRLPRSGNYSIRASVFGIATVGAYTLSIADMNEGKVGRTLWGGVTPVSGCGHAAGTRTFTPIMYKAAPVRIGGRRRLDGVIIINGREVTREEAGFTYAENRPWFESSEQISVGGRRYAKYAMPRLIDARELEFFVEHDGVAAAVAAGDAAHDVIYLHVNGFECSFQPYQVTS